MEPKKKRILTLVSQLEQKHTKYVLDKARHLLNSGAVSFEEDPELIAKSIYYVALGDVRQNWRPLADAGKAIVKNLEHS